MMTSTKLVRRASSAPAGRRTSTRPIAEAMYENIRPVGLPTVGRGGPDAGARRSRRSSGSRRRGLPTTARGDAAGGRRARAEHAAAARTTSATCRGTCRRSRCAIRRTFPDLPGHNWANAIAMATPIAHKGATAGAKVQAMTMLDLLPSRRSSRRRGTTSGTCRRRRSKYQPAHRARTTSRRSG